MAKYRVTSPTFVGGTLLSVEGTEFTIDDSWIPNQAVEPVDAAAQAAYDTYMVGYRKKHPDFQTDAPLPLELGNIEMPSGKVEEVSLSIGEAQLKPAMKGPTDGGKVPPK